MKLSIREATKKDGALISDLSRQTFYETFAAYNTKEDMDKFLKEQFIRSDLILEVGKPDNYFFIAYVNNIVAGYVKLREVKQPLSLDQQNSLEIARLYAVSSFIGKGIGKLLMQKSLEVAKEKQKKMVWLGVWEKNVRAIEFYQKCGFEKFGEQEFLLGNDLQRDWLMKKEL